jgi:hypothetical protein
MAFTRTSVVQRPFMAESSDLSGTALHSPIQIEASSIGSTLSKIDGSSVNHLVSQQKGNLT